MRRRNKRSISVVRSAALEALEDRQLLSGGTMSPLAILNPDRGHTIIPVQGITPAVISNVYNFNKITFGNSTVPDGAGQTIALTDATYDPAIVSDLAVFDREFSLQAPPSFEQISQTGGSATELPQDASWDGEIALDVEWAHAIAPAANIVLVDAVTSDTSNLMAAVNEARSIAGVSVVSISWGGTEYSGQTAYDSYFTTPKHHTPITFVAAAGDDGIGYGPEWPATSDNVLGVGGTTLGIHRGRYASEAGWTDTSGGVSTIEGEPSFQSAVAVGGARNAPDVAYAGDPDTGFAVYDSVPYQGYVGWQVEGGTSAGAPQWAALIAIADQGRVLAGKSALNGTTQTMPTLYSLYNNATTYAANFNDVGAGLAYDPRYPNATTGFDSVTGLGTPKANAVVASLIASNIVTPASIVSMPAPTFHHHRFSNFAQHPNTPAPARIPVPAASPAEAVPHETPQAVFATSNKIGAVSQGADSIFNAKAIATTGTSVSSLFQSGVTVTTLPTRATYLTADALRSDQYSTATDILPSISTTFGVVKKFLAGFSVAGISPAGATVVSAGVNFSFPHLDAVAAFTDGVAAFAEESATLQFTPATPHSGYHLTRAWVVTAGVLVLDMIVLGRWYAQRKRKSLKTEREEIVFAL